MKREFLHISDFTSQEILDLISFAAELKIKLKNKEGFSEAFSSIVDGHLTTLISCLSLFSLGIGFVKGFAATLGIGIRGRRSTGTRTFPCQNEKKELLIRSGIFFRGCLIMNL